MFHHRKKFSANFIRIRFAENKGIYEYRVEFSPQLDDVRTRKKVLRQCDELGHVKARNFDGQTLDMANPLPRQVTSFFNLT